jgi:hypothetical protein
MLSHNPKFFEAWPKRSSTDGFLDLWFASEADIDEANEKALGIELQDCLGGVVSLRLPEQEEDYQAANRLQELGLLNHDIVHAINGNKTEGMDAARVSAMMEEAGVPHTLTVRRQFHVTYSTQGVSVRCLLVTVLPVFFYYYSYRLTRKTLEITSNLLLFPSYARHTQ